MTNEQHSEQQEQVSVPLRIFDSIFEVLQFVGLCAIAVAAVVGFATELWRMATADGVALGDLLLLFLYTEVLIMARAALHSHHELAIVMPIAMAVVALGRYMVVSSDHNALHQIMYAAAVFILVAALFLWKVGRRAGGSIDKANDGGQLL